MRNLLRILTGLIFIGLALTYLGLCIQDLFPIDPENLISENWFGFGQFLLLTLLLFLVFIGGLAIIIFPGYFVYQFVVNEDFRFWWEKTKHQ